MDDVKKLRALIRADGWTRLAGIQTDQQLRVPQPPVQQLYPADARLIDLVAPADFTIGALPLLDAINNRQSRRRFSDAALSLEELSFLCWAVQGVKELSPQGTTTMRTVPSGGARHPFELYLLLNRAEGLPPGVYRYLAVEHKLCCLRELHDLPGRIVNACLGQSWAGRSAAVFVWVAVPYRMEWRYSLTAHKTIALDAGHSCQNLYLAVEAIGCGTCAIGAYHQQELDWLLGVDGEDEFAVYAAPVGKV